MLLYCDKWGNDRCWVKTNAIGDKCNLWKSVADKQYRSIDQQQFYINMSTFVSSRDSSSSKYPHATKISNEEWQHKEMMNCNTREIYVNTQTGT